MGPPPHHVTGTLTWNANGTLRDLSVVDGTLGGLATEACVYGTGSNAGYDELGRLLYTDCWNGSTPVWGQTFSYDQYDNVTKSVPTGQTGISWAPGYNPNNNRYLLSGTTYDSNGNLLTDTFHTYTWNQDNRLLSLDSTADYNMLYDALGRLVEWHGPSNIVQNLYSPIGKVAKMTGQSVTRFEMPLPGGSTAIPGYEFEHSDNLGTIPFISYLTSRNSYATRLFAPYGETYNNHGGTNDVAFTGDRQDLVAGTYDTPNRELNPTQGRRISPDPAGASWNAYSYSTNPMGEIDPSGLGPIDPTPYVRGWRTLRWSSTGGPPTYGWSAMEDLYGTIQDLAMSNTGVIGNSPSQFVQGAVLLPAGMTPTTGTVTATGYVSGVATPVAPGADDPGVATVSQRVTAGVQGVLNLGLAIDKGYQAGEEAFAGLLATPTGPPSWGVLAKAGYDTTSAIGQATSATGQFVIALSENPQAGQQIQQVGDIMSGPATGISTLMITGDAATAQRNANFESFIFSGAGLVDSMASKNVIQSAVDFGLSALGLVGQ